MTDEINEPSKLWAHEPSEEAAAVIKRIRDTNERNDINSDSNEHITLNADEMAALEIYLLEVRRGESDYRALGETLLDGMKEKNALISKMGKEHKRSERGWQIVIAILLVIALAAMGSVGLYGFKQGEEAGRYEGRLQGNKESYERLSEAVWSKAKACDTDVKAQRETPYTADECSGMAIAALVMFETRFFEIRSTIK